MSAGTKEEVIMSAKRLAWPACLIAVGGVGLTAWLVSSIGQRSAGIPEKPRLRALHSDDLHRLREPQKFREDMRLMPRTQPTPIFLLQP
jgi:hypothetical protein